MFRLVIAGLTLMGCLGGGFLWFAPSVLESNFNKVETTAPLTASAQAKAIHARLFLADLHTDSLLWNRDLLSRTARGHVDVPRLQEGRFGLQVFAAVTKVPQNLNYDRNSGEKDQLTLLLQVQLWPPATWSSLKERALYQATKLHGFAAQAPDRLTVIRHQGDLRQLRQAQAQGRSIVGALLATEGAHPLEGQIGSIQELSDAGYRVIGLQHFFDNELGGSLHGISKGGLTDFGRQAVAQIERLNLIIDLAHSSAAVMDDVLAIATRPVIVSHTGVQGTCKTVRNLSDAHIRAIAAKGGLIGIGYWDAAVCDTSPRGVARAIRYAISVAGVEHVALGSDYDGSTTVQFDASQSVVLVQALLDEGLSEDDIGRVLGGNAYRLFGALLPPA